MTGWWRKSLGGQIVGLLLIALLIGQAVGFLLSWQSRNEALRITAQSEFISRTATVAEVVTDMPAEARQQVLRASATTHTRFWTSAGDPRALGRDWYIGARAYLLQPLSDIINARVLPDEIALSPEQEEMVEAKTFVGWSALDDPLWTYPVPALMLPFEDQIGMGLTVELPDGRWLNAILYKRETPDAGLMQSLISTLIAAAMLGLAGVFAARRIARPLQTLTEAAGAIGRGEVAPDMPQQGPEDVRKLHEAFAVMQQRLHHFVEDRTLMLAAIGHDLRTPLTALRLRVEMLQDDALRAKMCETLDEMQRMTEATLSFARVEATSEGTRNFELGALLESLCDDMADMGHDVSFQDAGKVNYRCRPDSLRRAVRNLIENAIRYGGAAEVSLKVSDSDLRIIVDDDGPGIPKAEQERVFAPFYRIDASRNTDTGGTGLGLAITRAIARQHGGEVELSPRRKASNGNRGLRATLILPRV